MTLISSADQKNISWRLSPKSRVQWPPGISKSTRTRQTGNYKKREWKKDRNDIESKILGSLLGDSEYMARRIKLAAAAFVKLKEMWSRRRIVSERKRLRTYNACIMPVLTYNACTWGFTEVETAKLDAFHRRQLKSLLGIRYPDTIHNRDLYNRTKSTPVSEIIFKARWRMFGHVLRMKDEVPSKQAMITNIRQIIKKIIQSNSKKFSLHGYVKKRKQKSCWTF